MKNLLIICALFVLLVACKKEHTNYLSDDIKNNFFYKPGSYWIYRDSISGREDSCYVRLSHLFTTNEDRKYTRFKEILQIGFSQVPIDVASIGEIYREIRFEKGIITINNFNFTYPISHTKQNVSWGGATGTTEWLDNYKLGINIYKNVFNINYEPINNANLYYRNYWLNDTVGFIKMRELSDTSNYVWELQRWHVIK